MLTAWHEQDETIMISMINLSEGLIAPASDQQHLRAARAAIVALGIAPHRPTETIAVDAARLRARHPISLPDSYLLATTRLIGATAASFDRNVLHAAEREHIPTISRW